MIELPIDKRIAGVDEAGRGPLAGSVVAAAVILPLDYAIKGLADSKKLSEKKRILLAKQIKTQAVAWSVAEASVAEIDDINILHASLLAMKRAVESLSVSPDEVWVDGDKSPQVDYPTKAIVKGDALVVSISAASILAKVARDEQMLVLDKLYPGYGFKQHKGYPTLQHRNALQNLGVLDIHRRSYAPVKKALLDQGVEPVC